MTKYLHETSYPASNTVSYLGRWPLLVLLTFLPGLVWAEELNSGDTAWILTSSSLVLFMTLPGLALFYSGMVRAKNAISILMQCFGVACLVTFLWLVVAYSLVFGEGAIIGDLSNIFLAEIKLDSLKGTVPESLFAFFQLTFAIITVALIVGAFAERVHFYAVLLFSGIWLLLVYAPVAHWIWGGGWLADLGVIDFAGGIVVHETSGISALVLVLMLGNRIGFPNTPMLPHNVSLTMIGAGMLLVGWIGFNGGSALAADGSAGMAVLVTHIAAVTAALIWGIMETRDSGKPTAISAVTGLIAGLASITPAAGDVGPAGAMVIGLVGGLACYFAAYYVKDVLKLDDSLDVFPVHCVGGIMGALMVSVFAFEGLGVFGGQGLAEGVTIVKQFGVQALAVLVVAAWSGAGTYIAVKLTSLVTAFRVTADEEKLGLDAVSHHEHAYDNLTDT